ncbi:MAG: NAD-binding protein [Mycobacterium sp.]|uniref:NAD-binding protein n=1 Tax=Mycobacterium sp. TaxID=1785 RepID=UPI003F98C39D
MQSDAQRRGDPGGLTGGRWSFRSGGRWLVSLLADYQWWMLGGAGVAAFVLGCIGSWHFLPKAYPQTHTNFIDAAYLSLKGFVINSTEVPGAPWQLDVSRYVAPVVTGWAGISALGLLFRDRVQQLKIPWMRGHVVICGLGEHVGIEFLRHLREARIRAVVVELNADNPGIGLCRSLGAPVIVGDAQRLKTLQAAGAHNARRVLAVTDADAVNTQIVATWRELPGRRSRQLGCLAKITDPEFCSMLRIQEAQRGEGSVDFFNIDEISARLMLKQFPLVTDCAQPHILVAHLDPLGVWLVYHAARVWHEHRREVAKRDVVGDKTAPLMVTVLDHKPEERIQALKSQHPELKNICDFKAFRPTAEDIRERLPGHHRDPATPHISGAYVTAYDDQQALETALRLHDQLHQLDPLVPVAVALSHSHGMAALLGDVKKAGALAHLEVFPAMERACTVELVWGGSFEPLAEDIHERWRTHQLKEHKPAPSWEGLDEPRKESSRAQARDIAAKLRSIHCAIAPLQNWNTTKDFTFTEEEVEKLAIDEHNRWWCERLADGWKLIPMPVGKDEAETKRLLEDARRRKESPYLIGWDDLLDRYRDIAEYDRIFVRGIPEQLGAVGLQVIRTDTAAAVPAGEQVSTAGAPAVSPGSTPGEQAASA